MIATCSEGICCQCGDQVAAGLRRTCPVWIAANPTPPVDLDQTPIPFLPENNETCPHLGEYTGDSVKLFGCGCASEKTNGIDTAVYECALHELCATFPHGTHLEKGPVHFCKTCDENPSKTPTPKAG